MRLREELDREREERNYFQLERDKIHTFWEITRRQLEDKKSELRNKDREMEERHQVEIKVRTSLLLCHFTTPTSSSELRDIVIPVLHILVLMTQWWWWWCGGGSQLGTDPTCIPLTLSP